MTHRKWVGSGLVIALVLLGLGWTRTAMDTDIRVASTSPHSIDEKSDPESEPARQPSTAPSLETAADPPSRQPAATPLTEVHAAHPRMSAARLDSASADVIRATLTQAVEEARRIRPLQITAAILESAARDGSVRVIFETEPGIDASRLAQTLDSGGRTPSVEDLRVFPLLRQGAALLSPGALLNLIAETSTSSIEPDAVQRASLLQSIPEIGADIAHADGFDGDGFAVAVIDTGVDTDHPMFGSRVIEEACFSLDLDCPNGGSQMFGAGAAAPCAIAGCDHGTHVAGIAVGDAETGPLVGVAPHAGLIAINVFSAIDGEPGAYTSDILAAMQHVLALSAFHDVAAVNLSLGGQAYSSVQSCSDASPSQVNAVNQLRNAGIATVAASGNEGLTNAISSPACLSNVISVGSVGDTDVVSSFSNSADFLSILAPGESIQSAAVGGGTRNGAGTSMATPHVAGTIATIREAMPDASVDEIENALALSGQPILDTRNGITTPRLRVDQTIATLEAAGSGSGGGGGSSSGSGAGDGGNANASSSSGGGGGGCGLVGIEPFLVLFLVRRARARSAA